MNDLQLTKQTKGTMLVRLSVQLIFLMYLVLQGEEFEVIAPFLIAIVASEAYQIFGTLATTQSIHNRKAVGLVVGVLNGMVYMMTLYFTGYTDTEYWVFIFVSIACTALDFGFYGATAEGLVMTALYIVTGGLSGIPYFALFVRSLLYFIVAVLFGVTVEREQIFESRFTELEKRKSLTKEERIRFVAVVSHSLRTPITAIAGYVDLLKKGRIGKMTKDQKEIVNKLADETKEMSGLIEDFLSVTVFEQKGVDIELAEFDLCELCKEIYSETIRNSEHKGVKYVFKSKAKVCTYVGDRSKLENAIKNIIDNAIKFTPPDGEVSFLLAMDNDNYIIEIKDTGVGIPKKEQEDIFSMFKRATNVLRYEYKGIGLGLYMSRMIIEALGGRIELESEEGRGSTFKIILPIGELVDVVKKLTTK